MRSEIISLAAIVGRDWTHGEYYDSAEQSMDTQWAAVIWPIIESANFEHVVEIAAGHGRNTEKLAQVSRRIFATDINQENIEFLKERFKNSKAVEVFRNSGADLRFIEGASASFVYSFDAMVHFDSDIIRSYIKEIRRILVPGGRAFCHYSGFDQNPTGTYRDHPGWRNFMSRELFEHWLSKEGFRILKSAYIQGVSVLTEDRTQSDNVTYFELPLDAEPGGEFLSSEERMHELDEASSRYRAEIATLNSEIAMLGSQLEEMKTSTSWQATAPIRWLKTKLSGR